MKSDCSEMLKHVSCGEQIESCKSNLTVLDKMNGKV